MTHRTTRSPDHDVMAVGAGPADLAPATQLARHGLDGVAARPRYRVATVAGAA